MLSPLHGFLIKHYKASTTGCVRSVIQAITEAAVKRLSYRDREREIYVHVAFYNF